MVMMVVHGAKERTIADFESLFQKVDLGKFQLADAGAFQSLLDFELLGVCN